MTRIAVDITSVAQWAVTLARTPAVRFSAFSQSEIAWCGEEAALYALAWAFKEAAVKLLGTGFDGIGWRGVWSCPTAAGVAVGLGPEARAAPGAADLTGPLRCAACSDEDRLLVALVAGRGDVAIRSLRVDCTSDRSVRHRASRREARRAAGMAAAALAPTRPAAPAWSTEPDCAPSASWEDGTRLAASFSHGPGLVCAGVVQEQKERSSGVQRSDSLNFEYDDELEQQLLRGSCC